MNTTVQILCVEDDPLDVKLVCETLRAGGLPFQLEAVETRAEFIRRIDTGHFDVILADYRLPGFSGREALALVRTRRPETPFIFVTGALGEEEAIDLLKQGATDYVLKNRLSRLGPAVQRALDEADAQRRRREADRALQDSNLRLTQVLESVTGLLERLFENKHVLIVHLDAQFNILRVNHDYAQFHQQALDFFAGKNYFTLHPDIDTQAIFRRVLETGEPFFAKAKPPASRGPAAGRTAFLDWSLQPVRNEHGQVEGLLLCLLDVTRHKRSQRARVVSERRYRELVENVDSIIMRWRPDGTITFANQFARQFFGFSAGELFRANVVGTIFPPADGAGVPLLTSIHDADTPLRQHEICECENQRRDGRRVWIRWTARAIRDAARNVVEILCVGVDITDRRQREGEMQRVQQRLRAMVRPLGATLQGRAVSPGLAEGVALLFQQPENDAALVRQPIAPGDVDREIDRFDRALADSVRELEHIREHAVTQVAEEEAAIMEVHLAMLQDPSFAGKCKQRVRDDLVHVEHAVAAEIRDLEAVLQGMKQEFMRERSLDVRDVGRRVLWNLRAEGGPPRKRLATLPPHTILVAEQLLPSDTLQLERGKVVAFITERDGPASHVAILARAMRIPAVCDVRDATSLLATGDRLLVDAENGTVTVAPTPAQTARFATRRSRQATPVAAARGQSQGCATRDGVGIRLHANLGRPDEARLVVECGLGGVGLFRSEFLFLDVDQPPDLDAQVLAYSTVARMLHPRPVVIRTMDLGGDKVPRFAGTEDNLKLRMGRRGLAFSLTELTLFRVQLQAILRAAQAGNIRIMFPMVLDLADMQAARRLVDELAATEQLGQRPPVGAMIETPSAVFAIREILEVVDFISIGTNDLAQYILAADRASPESSGAPAFLHPGVLRATHQVVRAAVEQAVEVSVCGEAAGNPATALLLIGMGVRSLSMSPFLAARVRQMVQRLTTSVAEGAAREALAAATAQDVEKIVSAAMKDLALDS